MSYFTVDMFGVRLAPAPSTSAEGRALADAAVALARRTTEAVTFRARNVEGGATQAER